MTGNEHDKLRELINSLRREHDASDEDCWFACPKSVTVYSDGEVHHNCCNDTKGVTGPEGKCDCGADKHNAIVDECLRLLDGPKPTLPKNWQPGEPRPHFPIAPHHLLTEDAGL